MSIQKLIIKISLILMILIEPLGSAIGQSVELSSCFQRINLTPGKNVKILNVDGQPRLFYRPRPYGSFPFFTVRKYDLNSNELVYVDFDIPYKTISDADGNPFKIYYHFQEQGFGLTSTESIIIDFYGDGPSYGHLLSTTVDFINPNEAFNFKPYDQSCFTYDNVRFKSDFLNLEGLCKNQYYTLTLPPDAPNRKGLGAYSQRVLFEDNDPASNLINIPIDQNECATTRPDGSAYLSYPYGCMNFNMDITLFSCYENILGYDDCPDKITVSVPINVCCACTAPSPNSRNTAGTALTGQTSELSIFPNPNNTGKLEINAANSPIRNIKIYAVDGRLVKELSVPEQNKVSVDISGLKPGMYQVKVSDMSNAVVTQKLVVQ